MQLQQWLFPQQLVQALQIPAPPLIPLRQILPLQTAALPLLQQTQLPPADASSAADDSSAAEIPADKVYNIGICQLVQHEALDAATQGFKDVLTEKLGADHVKFDEQNANGESTNCTTICTGFAASGVDLDPG